VLLPGANRSATQPARAFKMKERPKQSGRRGFCRQAPPHRPGISLALVLRAKEDALIVRDAGSPEKSSAHDNESSDRKEVMPDK
jgi:hypothetical protein